MTGPAEDLQVLRCVYATKRQGDDVIDIPILARPDLSAAGLALPSRFQEEIQSCFGGETETGHSSGSMASVDKHSPSAICDLNLDRRVRAFHDVNDRK